MSLEENKRVARRVFEEFFNNYELALADELIAPEVVDHNPLPGQPSGPEGIKWVNTMLHSAHSNLKCVVDDVIAEDDRVVVRWTLQGINTGSMLGMPPSGKDVAEYVIAIFRIKDGKIVERWAAFAR